ncbi:TPA: TrkA family potassium uptake protein [Candidatus Bathyarchaeota archaeon]|nr:TrkA family potassium uptake protein [Candidatus Bathyarchaeota archaeon]
MVYIAIIGAGNIGTNLVRYFSERGDRVAIIDKDEERCKHISENYDATIFCGDATNLGVLKNAELEKADVLYIVTNNDEINARLCKLAKERFAIPYVIARVNHIEAKEKMMEAGADAAICPNWVAISSFQNAIEQFTAVTLLHDRKNQYKVVQVTIPINASVIGKSLGKLKMSPHCRIGLILREGNLIYPNDETVLHLDDRLLVFGKDTEVEKTVNRLREAEMK